MRIVAIDASHGLFGKPVMIWPLKPCPDIQMATSAQLIHRRWLSDRQLCPSVRMNFVTGDAGDLVFRMAALQPADVGRLIQMAGEADFIGLGGGEFRRIADLRRICRFGVLLTGPVTRFANAPLPTALLVRIDYVMRAFRDCIVDVLVANLAGVRAGIARGKLLSEGRKRRED